MIDIEKEFPNNNNILGAYQGQPQLLGLIDVEARNSSIDDSRSLCVEIEDIVTPVIVPIEYATEANQDYFKGAPSLFFDSSVIENVTLQPWNNRLNDYIEGLPAGTKILFEIKEGDTRQEQLLRNATQLCNRSLVLDAGVIDSEVGTLAGVRHYFSRHNTLGDGEAVFETVSESYNFVKETPEWQVYKEEGVSYVNGINIDTDLLEELWQVYDKTFDKLVENHPSAQKQPREYFDQQVLLKESQVTFVRKEGVIVSALFGIDDLTVCPWLNLDFFKEINPEGKTAFIPGASTPLNMSGLGYAELTMGAMGVITQRVPGITGVATQCTNRSETYLPGLGERYTKDTTKFKFTEIGSYKYPVFIIE